LIGEGGCEATLGFFKRFASAMKKEIAIHWFRRDLRLSDNAGLYHALRTGHRVLCLFIFDSAILDRLDDKRDLRLVFIHRALERIRTELRALGSDLRVEYGLPEKIWARLADEFEIKGVFACRDYEPYALQRDRVIYDLLSNRNVTFKAFKDQVIFDRKEVVKEDGTPYQVFTPYSRKWKTLLNDFYLKPYPTEHYMFNLLPMEQGHIPSLAEMGFADVDFRFPPPVVSREILHSYADRRDIPSVEGTSRISVHLRFGTVSIRQLAALALRESEKWLNELIWRDFYQMILYHFPHSADGAFRPIYDRIEWLNNEAHFDAWCNGMTGYPLVDAGMRELNETGHMHNRVRMVVASFLTKHLLIDWRWGERYFAKKLLDFDLSANCGGWQWAAGSGVDAAPYFRVFNPAEQQRKFDPDLTYVRKWVPEWGTAHYPEPIVEHATARKRAIDTYQKSLK